MGATKLEAEVANPLNPGRQKIMPLPMLIADMRRLFIN